MKNKIPSKLRHLTAATLVSLCSFFYAAGQMNLPNANVIPPTPEASSLAKYAETPVGLYTGTPEISIPLWTIADHSLSLPISLSYHSSGNRVEDIGSSVGLGWSLNAGGAVVRTVRGMPDEQPTFGFLAFSSRVDFQNVMTGTDFTRYMRYDSIVKGCIDAEPDNFFFNFDGLTGRLSFDWGGNLVISCAEKIKVSYQLSSGVINSWTITRANGATYVFSDGEITQAQEATVSDDCKSFSPFTSWYLTEVRSANNTHKLKFFYNSYDLGYNMTVGEQDYYRNGISAPEAKSPKTIRQLYMSGKLISRIESSDGSSLSFVYNNLRTDITGNNFKSLDEIQARDLNGTIKRRFLFSYDYSTGRLTLKQLRETDAVNPSLRPPYNFFYNPVALPSISSYAQDHWGYYNSNTNATTLIPALSTRNLPMPSDTNSYMHAGANREVDPARTQAGMLTQIIYPAGNESFYEYEPNDYGFIQQDALPNGATRITGGVRVKRIIQRDGSGNSPDNTRIFSYRMQSNGARVSSGVIFSEIKYTYDYTQREYFNGTYRIIPFTVAMASNRAQLGSVSGTHIGYRQVEVLSGAAGEGGKTVSTFSSAFDNPDALYDFQPFPPSVSSDHNRGQLLNEKKYKYTNGQYVLVKELRNHYTSLQQIANGYKMGYGIGGTYEPGNYDVSRFSITNYRIALGYGQADSSEEIVYENGESFSSKTAFQYDANLQFLKARTEKVSNGKDLLTEYFYPQDFPNPNPVVQTLLSRNVFPVLEQIISEKGSNGIKQTIAGNFLEYGLYGSQVLPYRSFQLLASKPLLNFNGSLAGSGSASPAIYGELMHIDGYDAVENILQTKGKSSETRCLLWGYNNTLVVAEVQNALSSDVAYCDFEDANQGGWSFDARAANYVQGDARTGSRSYKGSLITRAINPSKTYKVSFWAKGTPGSSVSLNDASQTLTADWTYFEWDVVDPASAIIRRPTRTANTGSLAITLPARSQVDGVRVLPAGAQMQTFTYDPLVGVTSTCSANNTIAYYEYDSLGRLLLVRDGNRNIVKLYQYKYANQ